MAIALLNTSNIEANTRESNIAVVVLYYQKKGNEKLFESCVEQSWEILRYVYVIVFGYNEEELAGPGRHRGHLA